MGEKQIPLIEIKNVSKKFKNEQVLDGINLSLYDDKIYGFVGRKRFRKIRTF